MRALTFCSYNINLLSTFVDYQTTFFLLDNFFQFYFRLLDIDDCRNHTCIVSGGYCVDDVNNYSCLCLVGFTGDHCETS